MCVGYHMIMRSTHDIILLLILGHGKSILVVFQLRRGTVCFEKHLLLCVNIEPRYFSSATVYFQFSVSGWTVYLLGDGNQCYLEGNQ